MVYVIPDTLLKVAFNTNKAGHHVMLIPDIGPGEVYCHHFFSSFVNISFNFYF